MPLRVTEEEKRAAQLDLDEPHSILQESRSDGSNHSPLQSEVTAKCAHPPTYFEKDGRIYWNKPKPRGKGVQKTELTNFIAHIITDVIRDDGQDQEREMEIEGCVQGGKSRKFLVSNADFADMKWPTVNLGAKAIVMPYCKDHARAAIQALSVNTMRQRRIYCHTGWTRGHNWMYLHAGGAIGATGLVDGVEVVLPQPLKRFNLPSPPTGDRLLAAIRASLRMIRVAPDPITIPIFASVWRACIKGADQSTFVSGGSGAGKSEVSALAQQHYGAGMDAKNLAAAWSSTENSLETLAFYAKDALLVIDDFAPVGSRSAVDALNAKADRVLRAQGNGSGRSRLKADSSFQQTRPPRGLILSTGEDTPKGQSLRARAAIIEMRKDDMDWQQLSAAQADAANGLYAEAMAGFLSWMAGQYEDVQERLTSHTLQLRDSFTFARVHPRTAGIAANLEAAFELFLSFAEEKGAITSNDAHGWKVRSLSVFRSLVEGQREQQGTAEPASHFLSLLAAAISSRQAHVAGTLGGEPEDSNRWGWSKMGDDARPNGPCVGWVCGEDLYIDPTPAVAAAKEMGRKAGEELTVTIGTLKRRLFEGGHLASTEEKRQTIHIRRVLQGASRNVLHLKSNDLLDSGGHVSGTSPDNTLIEMPLTATALAS